MPDGSVRPSQRGSRTLASDISDIRYSRWFSANLSGADLRFSGPERRAPAQRGVVLALLASIAALGLPSTAVAGGLDLHFEQFIDKNPDTRNEIENSSYKQLMREVSMALGPRMAGPAASGGSLGIEASYEVSAVGTNSTADYWAKAASTPQSIVTTQQVRVRKGLPYSMQVGGVVTSLGNSNLTAIGVELGVNVTDGYKNIPDIVLRPSIHTVLGNSQIDMFIVGLDLAVSKSFGIGGIVSLQPWVAYSPAFTHVNTHQVTVYSDDKAIRPVIVRLAPLGDTSHIAEAISQRAAIGVRVVVTRVQIGAEFLRSFSESLSMFTGKIGVTF